MTAGSRAAALPSGPAAEAATTLFGAQLPLAVRFAELLVTAGIERGLIGPREAPRVWERHLLNCAVLTDLVPPDARVVDVGSGAGLPGLVLAVRRPDLSVDLVEPLQRRTDFLSEAVADLGLTERVRVVRGRADEPGVLQAVGDTQWLTARAVAPLDRLVRWCLPLLAPGGRLLALKGRTAEAELVSAQRAIARSGGAAARVVNCPVPNVDDEAVVVVVERRRKGKA